MKLEAQRAIEIVWGGTLQGPGPEPDLCSAVCHGSQAGQRHRRARTRAWLAQHQLLRESGWIGSTGGQTGACAWLAASPNPPACVLSRATGATALAQAGPPASIFISAPGFTCACKLLLSGHDPLQSPSLICILLFYNIWNALKRQIYRDRK